MNHKATDPSPTPEAARFSAPCRTSPTAKRPGTFVSSKKGSRSSDHPLGRWPSRIRSGPVRMNPRSSRSTTSASQSVLGSAPIKMNIAPAGTRSTLFVSEHRNEISSRCVSPCTSDTHLEEISFLCRSEEHTSELQSLTNLVCRLLLEKNKSFMHKSFFNTDR